MRQQKKFTKSNVRVAANCEENAQNKCRGFFYRPHFEDITKKRGITLISLVITIVVMLILAGVAISIALDPEGLFGQAEKAKTDWNAKVDDEEDAITNALSYLGINPPSKLPEGWDSTKVADVVTQESALHEGEEAKVRNVPIPVGYTASGISTEDEIKEGLVIYQTKTAVTGDPNSDEHITAMEGINQYVWIPVDDINDMVMCKSNGSNKKIDGTTATEGEKTTCELVYDAETDKITCNVHGYTTETVLTDDNINFTGLAGRAYGKDSSYLKDSEENDICQTSMEFTEEAKAAHRFVANSTSSDSTYREPDLVTFYDVNDVTTDNNETNDYMKLAGITTGLAKDFKKQLNNKFIEMAKSVAKYGGFYISRFEPGYTNDKVISKKNQKVLIGASTANDSNNYIEGNTWYGLYNKTLNSTEKENSVNSHMIWGCQYDQVIKFIGEKAQIGHAYQTKSQVVTGYNGDEDILNNIYDLEGNNFEWTAQAFDDGNRVYRGGYFFGASRNIFYPTSEQSSYNTGYPTGSYDDCTTRYTLYVK